MRIRLLYLLAGALGLVTVGACGLSDGDDDADPQGPTTFDTQPPFDAVHADGTCGYRASDGLAGATSQSGHVWTYESGRAVRHTIGWDGSTRIVETWSYDTDGRLITHERLAADSAPDDFVLADARRETWTWDAAGHLTGWTLDELADGRLEQTWTWRWDDQGRITSREANLDADAALDYVETTNWLNPTTEITTIDTDGDAATDVRIERHVDDAGQVVESIRTGGMTGAIETRVERVDTDYVRVSHFDRDGTLLGTGQQSVHHERSEWSATEDAVWSLDDACFYHRERGTRVRYGFGYSTPPDDMTIFAEETSVPLPVLRWDASANVVSELGRFDFTYDGDFVGAHCGGEAPHAPLFPWPVPVSARSLGIDMLCRPEHLACRHLDPTKVIRCPQM